MPKILFITPGCFDKGGISRYSRYQIQSLREIVGSAHVRTLSLLGPTADSFEAKLSVTWFGTGPHFRSKASLFSRAVLHALLWRPDIIHVAHVNFSGVAVAIARVVGARVLLNTYGLEVWSGFTRDAAWGLQCADWVMSDCHFTASYLEEQGLRKRGSVRVIWDCVDNDRFNTEPGESDAVVRAAYGIPDPGVHHNVMTLGRVTTDAAHKGYSRLVAAFAIIAREFDNARLVVGGKGDLCEHLADQAARLGIANRLVFTGTVTDDDLPAVYRSATVFSLISDRGNGRGEGIPLTPLEAMACGAPILVGNQDGSQEAVINGSNGIVLDPFDQFAHEAALRLLLQDAPLRKRMGDAGAALAKQEFSFATFREKHRKLLNEIVPEAHRQNDRSG